MSHESGKVEVLAVDQHYIYLRYHQAKYAEDEGRFFLCHRDDDAYWLDQLEPVDQLGVLEDGVEEIDFI